MRKQLLILAVLIQGLCITSLAQKYKRILDCDTCEWDVIGNLPPEIFKAYGDTIINGESCKKLYTYSNSINYKKHIGFLSEDTVCGKFWLYNSSYTKKILLMDLCLNPGDTFKLATFNDSIPIVVKDTGKVPFKINFKYRLQFSFGSDSIRFIEGVGPSYGFPYYGNQSWGQFDNHKVVQCVYKNSIQTYKRNHTSCLFSPVDIHDVGIYTDFISFFPNPTDSYLKIHLTLSDNSFWRFNIINTYGVTVLTRIVNDPEIECDLSFLDSGVYILNVIIGEKSINAKLIIR